LYHDILKAENSSIMTSEFIIKYFRETLSSPLLTEAVRCAFSANKDTISKAAFCEFFSNKAIEHLVESISKTDESISEFIKNTENMFNNFSILERFKVRTNLNGIGEYLEQIHYKINEFLIACLQAEEGQNFQALSAIHLHMIENRKILRVLSSRGIGEEITIPGNEDNAEYLVAVTRQVENSGAAQQTDAAILQGINNYVTKCGLSPGCISACIERRKLKLRIIQLWKDKNSLREHLNSSDFSAYQQFLSGNNLGECVGIQQINSL